MARIAREPLLHFLVLGALLFGLDALVGDRAGAREIVVTEQVREEIAGRWAKERGRAPGPEELEVAIARWVDEEILYREAIARGLDRNDPALRSRVGQKMLLVLSSQAMVPEPSEAELRAHYEQQRERYADVARIDFTHVFFEGEESERRAEEILALLRGGASPNGLGDPFSGGRRYRRRAIADLAAAFGEEFVAGFEQQAEGAWVLRRSRFGVHLVRIDRRAPAREGRFEEAREDVRHDVMDAARDRAVAREVEKLRASWVVR